MAQLVVRNLPDDVKERLKERAKRHGRSLEAEAREVLERAANLPAEPAPKSEGWATELAQKISQHEVSQEAWDEFDRALLEQRASWRDRPLDFEP